MDSPKQKFRVNKKRSTLRKAYGRKLDQGQRDLERNSETQSINDIVDIEKLYQTHHESLLKNSAISRVSPVLSTISTSTMGDKAPILSETEVSKNLQSNRRRTMHRSSFDKPSISQFLYSNIFLITLFTFFLLGSIELTNACNEAVCASIVSKCTLLKSCECEITEDGCPCCKTCFMCLDYLQTDCCSCVGLCPRPNNTAVAPPQKSKVMDFPDGGMPSLWDAIVPEDGDDANNQWTSYKYPEDKIASELTPHEKKLLLKKKKPNQQQQENQSVDPNPSIVTFNCTVTFHPQCMAENKCEKSCQSMGAYQYRWFQNGCCECVGHHCKNYGINEPKCLECGDDEDDELEVDELTDEEIDQLSAQYESEIQDLS